MKKTKAEPVPQFVTLKQLCKRLGLSPQAIRGMESRGEFVPHIPMGGSSASPWAYLRVDIDKWLADTTAGRIETLAAEAVAAVEAGK